MGREIRYFISCCVFTLLKMSYTDLQVYCHMSGTFPTDKHVFNVTVDWENICSNRSPHITWQSMEKQDSFYEI